MATDKSNTFGGLGQFEGTKMTLNEESPTFKSEAKSDFDSQRSPVKKAKTANGTRAKGAEVYDNCDRSQAAS
jgi:hypothetical protein